MFEAMFFYWYSFSYPVTYIPHISSTTLNDFKATTIFTKISASRCLKKKHLCSVFPGPFLKFKHIRALSDRTTLRISNAIRRDKTDMHTSLPLFQASVLLIAFNHMSLFFRSDNLLQMRRELLESQQIR